MSKQSYMNGFCKAAAANNVDPRALARFAVEKAAADAAPVPKASLWDEVLSAIDAAKNKAQNTWKGLDPNTRELLKLTGGALGGAALGTGLGAVVGGKRGLGAGAVIGALGGGAAAGTQVDWNALAQHFGNMTSEAAKRVKAHNDALKKQQEQAKAKAEGGKAK